MYFKLQFFPLSSQSILTTSYYYSLEIHKGCYVFSNCSWIRTNDVITYLCHNITPTSVQFHNQYFKSVCCLDY